MISRTRHGTFRTMFRSATPKLRHTEMRRTGPAPYWNASYRNSATPELHRTGTHHTGPAPQRTRHTGMRHGGLRHSGMTP